MAAHQSITCRRRRRFFLTQIMAWRMHRHVACCRSWITRSGCSCRLDNTVNIGDERCCPRPGPSSPPSCSTFLVIQKTDTKNERRKCMPSVLLLPFHRTRHGRSARSQNVALKMGTIAGGLHPHILITSSRRQMSKHSPYEYGLRRKDFIRRFSGSFTSSDDLPCAKG